MNAKNHYNEKLAVLGVGLATAIRNSGWESNPASRHDQDVVNLLAEIRQLCSEEGLSVYNEVNGTNFKTWEELGKQ